MPPPQNQQGNYNPQRNQFAPRQTSPTQNVIPPSRTRMDTANSARSYNRDVQRGVQPVQPSGGVQAGGAQAGSARMGGIPTSVNEVQQDAGANSGAIGGYAVGGPTGLALGYAADQAGIKSLKDLRERTFGDRDPGLDYNYDVDRIKPNDRIRMIDPNTGVANYQVDPYQKLSAAGYGTEYDPYQFTQWGGYGADVRGINQQLGAGTQQNLARVLGGQYYDDLKQQEAARLTGAQEQDMRSLVAAQNQGGLAPGSGLGLMNQNALGASYQDRMTGANIGIEGMRNQAIAQALGQATATSGTLSGEEINQYNAIMQGQGRQAADNWLANQNKWRGYEADLGESRFGQSFDLDNRRRQAEFNAAARERTAGANLGVNQQNVANEMAWRQFNSGIQSGNRDMDFRRDVFNKTGELAADQAKQDLVMGGVTTGAAALALASGNPQMAALIRGHNPMGGGSAPAQAAPAPAAAAPAPAFSTQQQSYVPAPGSAYDPGRYTTQGVQPDYYGQQSSQNYLQNPYVPYGGYGYG